MVGEGDSTAAPKGAVVGPVPEGADPDTYDRLRRRVLWSMPSGLYLVGSRSGDEVNLMAANWAMQVATDPKVVAVGIEAGARTHELISVGGVFSVNILAREDRPAVRRFVKPAEWDPQASTLNGFPVCFATTGAPIFAAAAAWLDCRVTRRLDFPSHTLFAGEVVDCAGDQLESIPVLRMEDTRMSYGG